MLRVIQLKLEDNNYHLFEQLAAQENHSLSNFAEIALVKVIMLTRGNLYDFQNAHSFKTNH